MNTKRKTAAFTMVLLLGLLIPMAPGLSEAQEKEAKSYVSLVTPHIDSRVYYVENKHPSRTITVLIEYWIKGIKNGTRVVKAVPGKRTSAGGPSQGGTILIREAKFGDVSM